MPPWLAAIGGFLAVALIAGFSGTNGASLIIGFLLVGLGLMFYFLPAVIANKRNANHSGMILFINLVFGWTVLGWIAALIWAIVEAPEATAPDVRISP